MTTDTVSVFEESLADLGVTIDRVPPDDIQTAITAAITEPAVAPLIQGLCVEDSSITPHVEDSPVTIDPTPTELHAATTGVTVASLAIADYGTVVLSERGNGSELVSLFVDRHVVILDATDVVPDMSGSFDTLDERMPEDTNDAVLATGPSATADMGALVKGAHGPESVHLIVVEGGT